MTVHVCVRFCVCVCVWERRERRERERESLFCCQARAGLPVAVIATQCRPEAHWDWGQTRTVPDLWLFYFSLNVWHPLSALFSWRFLLSSHSFISLSQRQPKLVWEGTACREPERSVLASWKPERTELATVKPARTALASRKACTC